MLKEVDGSIHVDLTNRYYESAWSPTIKIFAESLGAQIANVPPEFHPLLPSNKYLPHLPKHLINNECIEYKAQYRALHDESSLHRLLSIHQNAPKYIANSWSHNLRPYMHRLQDLPQEHSDRNGKKLAVFRNDT